MIKVYMIFCHFLKNYYGYEGKGFAAKEFKYFENISRIFMLD